MSVQGIRDHLQRKPIYNRFWSENPWFQRPLGPQQPIRCFPISRVSACSRMALESTADARRRQRGAIRTRQGDAALPRNAQASAASEEEHESTGDEGADWCGEKLMNPPANSFEG